MQAVNAMHSPMHKRDMTPDNLANDTWLVKWHETSDHYLWRSIGGAHSNYMPTVSLHFTRLLQVTLQFAKCQLRAYNEKNYHLYNSVKPLISWTKALPLDPNCKILRRGKFCPSIGHQDTKKHSTSGSSLTWPGALPLDWTPLRLFPIPSW